MNPPFINGLALTARSIGLFLFVTAASANGEQPSIILQPINQTVVLASNTTFSATASGAPAPDYQWLFNGSPISGATNSTFTVSNTSFANAGNYQLIVTNTFGSVTSSVAQLFIAGSASGYAWTNFAGLPGSSGTNDGTGSTARFGSPVSVGVSLNGNIYVADQANHTIRKVTSGGVVTTLAGFSEVSGTNDGSGSVARFNRPRATAVDADENVYVADESSHTIRKVTPAGIVTTLAGLGGISGTNDGTGSAARFGGPAAVAVDASGNVFVGDALNRTIRRITPAGVVTTLAGSAGASGTNDGTGNLARFNSPYGVAIDGSGNLFVADYGNYLIRKVTPAGVVTTVAGAAGIAGSQDGTGSNARFNTPIATAVDAAGNIFVADYGINQTIRKITPAGVVTTVGGTAGMVGPLDGIGAAAQFYNPAGVGVSAENYVYVADYINRRITKGTPIYSPVVSTSPQSQIVLLDTQLGVPIRTNATFNVAATSSTPASYQWLFNGSPIFGATNTSLTVSNVMLPNGGNYRVVVTNVYGAVTSSVAVLTVFIPPQKEWEVDLGGTGDEGFGSVLLTSDGGVLLAGHSESGVSGNKTNSNAFGQADWWLVKVNTNGIKQWEKVFGGNDRDTLNSIRQAADGGYLLGGTTLSPVSGNKLTGTYGLRDLWLMKLDSNGIWLWETNYGGSDNEYFGSMDMTADGGCIMVAASFSGISGNKTTANNGGSDFWVVKVDGNGVKQWDKDFGGNANDAPNPDSIHQTSDGGYIVGGLSTSGATGNKTTANLGQDDYWVFKLDGSGNKQWEKGLGGTGNEQITSVRQTSDGGYIAVGSSDSGLGSGTKTSASFGNGDLWIIKLAGNGNEQWQKSYGGAGIESDGEIVPTSDGGYLLSCTSASAIGTGNKTSTNYGAGDYWLLKLDASGNKIWEKTFGGSSDEAVADIQVMNDGGVLLGGRSQSGFTGNKLSSNYGGNDYWVVKLSFAPYFPVSSFTVTPNPAAINQPITFDGSASYQPDPAHSITNISWDFDASDGLSFATSGAVVSHAYSAAGTYQVTIKATDDSAPPRFATISTPVTVYAAAPTAVISSASPTTLSCPVNVATFTQASSAFPGRTLVSWTWNFGDGVTVTTNSPSFSPAHYYTAGQNFTVTLTVTDDLNATSSATTNIAFINHAPNAVASPLMDGFGQRFYNIFQGNSLPLNGGDSSDQDSCLGDAIMSYQWDLNNDGTYDITSSFPTINVASSTLAAFGLSSLGSHTIKLKVIDSHGASSTAPGTVTIGGIQSQPQSQTIAASSNATFSVTAVNTTPLYYQWLLNGVVISGATNTALTVSNAAVTQAGNYQVIVSNIYDSVISSTALLTVNGILFQDSFDPSPYGTNTYYGGDVENVSLAIVPGVGVGGTAALRARCDVSNGPNGYGYLAAQWQDETVSGNVDTNLSHYRLSFDAYVTGDALHQSGGGFSLGIGEGAGPHFSTPFPQGSLQTYQPYQGGADLRVNQSGVWQHFDINLGGPMFTGTNGFNDHFDPTGATWQINFQMNTANWGAEPQTGTTLIIDNLMLTLGAPPVVVVPRNLAVSNGQFGFDLSGPAGTWMVIQASTNLLNWVSLQTNMLSGQPVHFQDPQPAPTSGRFYRVFPLP